MKHIIVSGLSENSALTLNEELNFFEFLETEYSPRNFKILAIDLSKVLL